jgi:hypothetical protein
MAGTISPRHSIDSKKGESLKEECIEASAPNSWIENFPLIRSKSKDELKSIEKSLLRKLDYKFLPFVTLMLLMK